MSYPAIFVSTSGIVCQTRPELKVSARRVKIKGQGAERESVWKEGISVPGPSGFVDSEKERWALLPEEQPRCRCTSYDGSHVFEKPYGTRPEPAGAPIRPDAVYSVKPALRPSSGAAVVATRGAERYA